MSGSIRIIGGRFRGKKIGVLDSEGLRPTPNRIRETLFNWLMHDIREARCLDAFAGSGALGLEAWSRGAAEVTFLEQVAAVHQCLSQTLQSFSSPNLRLIQTDAYHYLQTPGPSYDVIFLDPPFAHQRLALCLENIKVLAVGGLLYVESEIAPEMDAKTWETLRSKKAGQVFYGLYKKL